jgi:serine/threonine-protein kinase HipA
MADQLTIQMRLGSTWWDAAQLSFDRTRVQVAYEVDHIYPADTEISDLPESFRALSLRWPLDLAPKSFERWPALLDDIGPGGAARRWWMTRLGLSQHDEETQRFILLRETTIAPIGHLRIKESIAPLSRSATRILFSIESVLEREHNFLDYAQMQGASIGGSTGAGGEAPKMLLRVCGQNVWIDALQEGDNPDPHYLVKFARRTHQGRGAAMATASDRDRTILESEAIYYQALAALGVETVDVLRMHLRHNANGHPSLWMPRFDVQWRDPKEVHFGMESLYALTDTPAGAQRDHQENLDILHLCLVEGAFLDSAKRRKPKRGARSTELVVEYIRRDLLNIVFGNSDNHGRNIAVLKTPEGPWLAPVYDFAPMVMDPEGIARTTRWNRTLEGAHGIDWRGVCRAQKHLADPDEVWSQLRAFALQLRDLDQRLEALGLSEETLTFPAIGFRRINDKLRAWDLLAEEIV